MYVSLNKQVKTPKVNVSRNRTSVLPLVLLIFLYLAVLLFIGFSEFVSAGLDLSTISTSAWWSKVITSIAINNLILLGTIMYKLQRDIDTREDVQTEKKRVDGLAVSSVDPVTFDPFLVDFNVDRKILKYKKALSYKMDKLNKKVKPKDLKAWVDWNREFVIWNKKTDEEKETIEKPVTKNKYVNRRLTLEIQMSNEFIMERIHYMRIKYKPIKKSFVTNGYIGRQNNDDQYDVESAMWKMVRDLGPKIIITAGYLAFINSLLIQLVEEPNWQTALVAIALKVIPIVMQIYNAITYVNAFIRDKVMVDFRTRWDIMIKYLASIKKEAPEKLVAKEVIPNGQT